jgi:hypothetical protein
MRFRNCVSPFSDLLASTFEEEHMSSNTRLTAAVRSTPKHAEKLFSDPMTVLEIDQGTLGDLGPRFRSTSHIYRDERRNLHWPAHSQQRAAAIAPMAAYMKYSAEFMFPNFLPSARADEHQQNPTIALARAVVVL